MTLRRLRMEDCIAAVPMPPGDAPIMAVGLGAKEFLSRGREPVIRDLSNQVHNAKVFREFD
jgi:hypothetical protein